MAEQLITVSLEVQLLAKTFETALMGAAGSGASDPILPLGTAFPGVGSSAATYLKREATLSNSADNKLATISFWFYEQKTRAGYNSTHAAFSGNNQSQSNYDHFNLYFNNNNVWFFGGQGSGTDVSIIVDRRNALRSGWNHYCLSFDLANSSNRYVFINGVDFTSVATFPTYTNQTMRWNTTNKWSVAASAYSYGTRFKGRLAHLFIDNSYLNLSTSSNLQKFITTDFLPAEGQAGLNPLIYLPMTDHTTAATNSGTGGNFTVVGNPTQAGRGPNQYNCVVSTLDGSADDLQNTSISHSGSKVFTISFAAKVDATSSSNGYIFHSRDSSNNEVFSVDYANGYLRVKVLSSGTILYRFENIPIVFDRYYLVNISFDLADSSKRHVYVNGISQSPTYNTYTNSNSGAPTKHAVGSQTYFTDNFKGEIGEVYYDTAYIDLSTSNPFWDDDLNTLKPVRQVIAETGNTPIIALPMQAALAGNNVGTGGDFTVTSGPYYGSRAPSEFMARSYKSDGSSGYLSRTSLTGASDTKTFSLAIAIRNPLSAINEPFSISSTNTNDCIRTYLETSGKLSFQAFNSSNSRILLFEGNGGSFPANKWMTILFSVDLANNATNYYINDPTYNQMVAISATPSTVTNDFIDLSNLNKITIGADTDGSDVSDGSIGFVYFTTDYINFSQEDNRYLFVDPMSYPVDLSKQISEGLIPEPLIYMPFNDPGDLGNNLGTGGDFTVNGTITPGPDVDVIYSRS